MRRSSGQEKVGATRETHHSDAVRVVVTGGLRVNRRRAGVRANGALRGLAGRRPGLALKVAVVVRLVAVGLAVDLALELVERDGRQDGRLVDDGGPARVETACQRQERAAEMVARGGNALVDLLVDRDDVVDGPVLVRVALDDGRDRLVHLFEGGRAKAGGSAR